MFTKIKLRLQPHKKIIRFLISGGSAAVTEYLIFILLEYLTNINVMAAQAVSFCCGLIVSFLLNKYWVFEAKATPAYKKEVILFLALGVCNLLITTLLIGILSMYIPSLVAKIILMVCVAVWNYLILNTIIFRSR